MVSGLVETQMIKLRKSSGYHGDTIGKIASSHYYVFLDDNIDLIATELEKNPNIKSFAVLDNDLIPVGIVVRNELFNRLGKKFGRDLYQRKPIKSLMRKADLFYAQKNIYTIANKLSEQIYSDDDQHYLLVDKNDQYFGIFTLKDLLIYLSQITQKDIDLAKTLQRNIVNETLYLEEKNFRILGYSKMAKGVGGDLYAFKQYAENKWAIIMGDVSGKGISASLITAIIGGMLNVYNLNNGFDRFIIELNRYLYQTFKLEKFVTALFIDLDTKKNTLTLYDMGHAMGTSNLYIYRKANFHRLKNKNYNAALGILDELNLRSDTFKIKDQDRFLFLTDGLLDQRSLNDEEYNIVYVKKIIESNPKIGLQKLKKLIMDDLNQFKSGNHQHDDITFILLDYFIS
ncbi:MAG: SpoIIE family protein phosphatase [Spirochaetes bacterium]|nr:SpoIIE family protein phosphatase [Spirochaetota bacterium]